MLSTHVMLVLDPKMLKRNRVHESIFDTNHYFIYIGPSRYVKNSREAEGERCRHYEG
ncbi:hypothetical protein LINPERHAP1_LOCUS14128 [Linum perenne]